MANANSNKVVVLEIGSQAQIQTLLKCDKCDKPMKTYFGLKMHRVACNFNLNSEDITENQKADVEEKSHTAKEQAREKEPYENKLNISYSTTEIEFQEKPGDIAQNNHDSKQDLTKTNDNPFDLPDELINSLRSLKDYSKTVTDMKQHIQDFQDIAFRDSQSSPTLAITLPSKTESSGEILSNRKSAILQQQNIYGQRNIMPQVMTSPNIQSAPILSAKVIQISPNTITSNSTFSSMPQHITLPTSKSYFTQKMCLRPIAPPTQDPGFYFSNNHGYQQHQHHQNLQNTNYNQTVKTYHNNGPALRQYSQNNWYHPNDPRFFNRFNPYARQQNGSAATAYPNVNNSQFYNYYQQYQ